MTSERDDYAAAVDHLKSGIYCFKEQLHTIEVKTKAVRRQSMVTKSSEISASDELAKFKEALAAR